MLMKETSYEKEYKVVFFSLNLVMDLSFFLVLDKCIEST